MFKPDNSAKKGKKDVELTASMLRSVLPAPGSPSAKDRALDAKLRLHRALSGALCGIGVLSLFVSVIVMRGASDAYDQAAVTTHWARVPAIVVTSNVMREDSTHVNNDREGRITPLPDAPAVFHPVIQYQVFIDKLPSFSDVISFPNPVFRKASDATEFISHYKQGQEIEAFKDPASTQTCLIPGIQSTVKKQETVVIISFLITFAFFVFAYMLFPEKDKLFKRN